MYHYIIDLNYYLWLLLKVQKHEPNLKPVTPYIKMFLAKILASFDIFTSTPVHSDIFPGLTPKGKSFLVDAV